MSEWQPIETAPKDGSMILLWSERVVIGSFRVDWSDEHLEDDSLAQWLDDSHDDFSTGYASVPLKPTHWMPLPPPPRKDA